MCSAHPSRPCRPYGTHPTPELSSSDHRRAGPGLLRGALSVMPIGHQLAAQPPWQPRWASWHTHDRWSGAVSTQRAQRGCRRPPSWLGTAAYLGTAAREPHATRSTAVHVLGTLTNTRRRAPRCAVRPVAAQDCVFSPRPHLSVHVSLMQHHCHRSSIGYGTVTIGVAAYSSKFT